MDALLVNLPHKLTYALHEPLGIHYLAAVCLSNNLRVDVLDGAVHGLTNEDIPGYAQRGDYKLIGISVPFENHLASALELVALLRKSGVDCHISLGGISPSLAFREILAGTADIDSIVVGEGEYTFSRLLSSIRKGADWRGIKGIAYRDGDQVVYQPATLIEDLDALPFPRIIDYRKEPYRDYKVLLSSSRGCCNACSFCSVHSFFRLSKGSRWRPRSPESVVGELEILSKQGVKYVWFADDNFFGLGDTGIKRALEIAALIKRRAVGVGFIVEARATEMKEYILKPLVQAGLMKVFVGVESIAPETLKFFNKGARAETNLEAIGTLERLGIDYEIGFLPFHPRTTLDELLLSLRFLKDLRSVKPFHLSKLAAYTGTPLQKSLQRQGLLKGDYLWYDYDFADPRVKDIWAIAEAVTKAMGAAYQPLVSLRTELHDKYKRASYKTNIYTRAQSEAFKLEERLGGILQQTIDLLICSVNDRMRGQTKLAAMLEVPLIEAELGEITDTLVDLRRQISLDSIPN